MQISAKSPDDIENLHTLRMLQLARASRDAFTARLQYHRLRLKELELMCSVVTDECEVAETFVKKAEWQIGEIKHILNREGGGLDEHGVRSAFRTSGQESSDSDDNVRHFTVSPSPSSYASYCDDSKLASC